MTFECDTLVHFYPRDAMLARVLAMALCPCLSEVGVLSKRMDGIICFLAREHLLTSYTLCFKEIQVCTKITALPSGTFFLNFGLRKFRYSISIVKNRLSSKKMVAPSVIDWTVVGKLS